MYQTILITYFHLLRKKPRTESLDLVNRRFFFFSFFVIQPNYLCLTYNLLSGLLCLSLPLSERVLSTTQFRESLRS